MIPQILWALDTKVIEYSRTDRIRLQMGTLEAMILDDGNVYVEHDTRKEIEGYLEYDESLTREFLKYCRGSEGIDCGVDWIKDLHPTPLAVPKGTKEWFPVFPGREQRKSWKVVGHGSSADDDWKGDRLSWVTFRIPEEDENQYREGALIEWGSGGCGQVWMGDVDEFMYSQLFPRDEDDLMRVNREFENGILWAMAEFGLLSDPEKIESELPGWVKEMIQHDPDLLWAELVADMDKVFDVLPWELQTAIREWKVRRMKEMEKATGQRYLWPRVYPGREE